MANARAIVKRRKAVRNIRKITRTMQLIATARFQAAFQRAVATKPYTEKLAELVSDISRAAGDNTHPLLKSSAPTPRSVLVVITTQRGLCGGYNANVLRSAIAHLRTAEPQGPAEVYMVGKKGINYFRFLGRPMCKQITNISDAPRFDQVEPIAAEMMDRFIRGEISSVHVASMRFLSMSRQRPAVIQLLPLEAKAEEKPPSGTSTAKIEYEFSPNPEELLAELLPATVRVRLFQCFIDAAVSEQIGRMVAMKAATDAAGDMIKALTRKYNRARQTQITMELLDIIGGVNALA